MPSNNQFKINEHGFTLIEVLASIVLLAIILTSFGMIFAQSLKTSNTSERIIDHTYIAQREMERIYELSTKVSVEHRIRDRKSTRLNSSHVAISYAVFCLKKKIDLEVPGFISSI